MVNEGNEVEHFIWFDDLVVRQNGGGHGAQPGSLRVAGHSGTNRPALGSRGSLPRRRGRRGLSSFMQDFETIESVDDLLKRVARSEPDADLIPKVLGWSPSPLRSRTRTALGRATQ